MKNARDAFDAYMPQNTRVGWRDDRGNPPSIGHGKTATTLRDWSAASDDEVKAQLRAVLDNSDPVEVEGRVFTEGGVRAVVSRKYERSDIAKREAIHIHGVRCQGCGFDFEEFYGPLGAGFIEVHHLQPLSGRGEGNTRPETDLAVLCSNCHRMVHRDRSYCLSLAELREAIRRAKNGDNA
ncbi:HNH endonuclease [cf. Phormidesmis sp. LEGE 11477]|uniref:HNH endonuclease n=1 Tax=cf. Phormidesmis sp. LEGE 11477 TaxID=1828680 RepID=UPI00188092DC|nr:HNH endonuclease [cf. Phormidesmis sp. LEGE 11477]MBE9064992.1 HNH endonuclease [cf. Phormidesmis sp. LEGE 11477]